MQEKLIKERLDKVAIQEIDSDEVLLKLRENSFYELGYANIDNNRQPRQEQEEVIYGSGKTKEQILGIVEYMSKTSINPILVTRMSAEVAHYLEKGFDLKYDSLSHISIIGDL